MDNAGGGRRGLRATPSRTLLEVVGRAYGIDCDTNPVDLGGSSSLNLFVGDDDRYVVRVYRPYVTPDRLRDIHVARRALAAGGVPCDGLLPTRAGQPWILLENRLVEVERYVEHDTPMNSWERLEMGLPLLGRMHAILRGLDVSQAGKTPTFANHIESTDALEWTLRGTRRIRAWNPSPSELQLAADADELARVVSWAERPFIKHLPRQLVHGDFWDNNVLVRAGRVVFVADFDFMGERARIDDLALSLYFTCMAFREDPVTDDQLMRLSRLVDAYDADSDPPLTTIERAALPLAIARQPLWSIGGWVALLDDDEAARRHAAGTVSEVEWALRLVHDVGRWQAAFA